MAALELPRGNHVRGAFFLMLWKTQLKLLHTQWDLLTYGPNRVRGGARLRRSAVQGSKAIMAPAPGLSGALAVTLHVSVLPRVWSCLGKLDDWSSPGLTSTAPVDLLFPIRKTVPRDILIGPTEAP